MGIPADTTEVAMCYDLEHLLFPTPPKTFMSESWEKNTLLIERANEGHYLGLLSLPDVDQIIAFSRPIFLDQNDFCSGEQPHATYVRGLLHGQSSLAQTYQPGIAELRQVFDQGKSVVMMGMQHRWQAVAELCRNLEMEFYCPVHANMYLTPAGTQGFAAHYDPHEVFILQLEGQKHWRLYEKTELLPLQSDKSQIPSGSIGTAREMCLKPGDLLYIPRGHVHDAYTTDTYSLHLTIGINVFRWADLMSHALTRVVKSDSRFRESIPGGARPGSSNELKQHFKRLLAHFSESTQGVELFDAAMAELTTQFYGELTMLPGTQFASPVNLDQIGIDTVLEKHRQAICRVVEHDKCVEIEFPGNRVSGPLRIAASLRFIAETERFAVRELPGELNDKAKIVLVRKLVREGLLAPVWQSLTSNASDQLFAGGSEKGLTPANDRRSSLKQVKPVERRPLL